MECREKRSATKKKGERIMTRTQCRITGEVGGALVAGVLILISSDPGFWPVPLGGGILIGLLVGDSIGKGIVTRKQFRGIGGMIGGIFAAVLAIAGILPSQPGFLWPVILAICILTGALIGHFLGRKKA